MANDDYEKTIRNAYKLTLEQYVVWHKLMHGTLKEPEELEQEMRQRAERPPMDLDDKAKIIANWLKLNSEFVKKNTA